MKKMKLVLLAAMIIGIGSAFTTAQPKVDELWVKGPDGVTLITFSESEAAGGICNSNITNEDCTYLDEEGTPDPNSVIGRVVYP
jgi:hypothetical protein